MIVGRDTSIGNRFFDIVQTTRQDEMFGRLSGPAASACGCGYFADFAWIWSNQTFWELLNLILSVLLRVARMFSALAIEVYIWIRFLSRGIRVSVLQRGVDAVFFSILHIQRSNAVVVVPLVFPGRMQ